MHGAAVWPTRRAVVRWRGNRNNVIVTGVQRAGHPADCLALAAGIGGEEHASRRIVVQLDDVARPLPLALLALDAV